MTGGMMLHLLPVEFWLALAWWFGGIVATLVFALILRDESISEDRP